VVQNKVQVVWDQGGPKDLWKKPKKYHGLDWETMSSEVQMSMN